MQTTPLTAAASSALDTALTVAICPHSAAPSALPPMMAIWYIDMPRARTQSGKANCADTLSELAQVIHAMPLTSIASTATQTLGATAMTAVAADCSSVARSTSTSRDIIWRRRGMANAAPIAPAPMLASSRVKVPAPPPGKPRAINGNSASKEVECKKNSATCAKVARKRLDCATNCMPTRIALSKRSRPSGLGVCSRRQRMMTKPEMTESTAFSTKTYSVPALAINAPATSGPMMRDAFIEMPLSASAAGSCARGTSSGTMAANTGQRIARPTPLAKVSASSKGGVMMPVMTAMHSSVATPAIQNCVMMK